MQLATSAKQSMFARFCLVTIVCLVGISYWLISDSNWSHTILSIPFSYRRPAKLTNGCLADIMLAFSLDELLINQSKPIYLTLDKPQPIAGSACEQAFAGVVAPPADFKKQELLTIADRERIYSIVDDLYTNFSRLELELFLAGGSLLGSVRHLGFIPWDADVDLMILKSQKPTAEQLLVEMSSSDEYRFVNTERSNDHWQLGILCQADRTKPLTRMYGKDRLYPEKSCKTIIDFFFGHVKSQFYERLEAPRSFPLHYVYPLVVRPYGPVLLPAPNKPESFLAAVYGPDFESNCLYKYFKHADFRCSSLASLYPFVKHFWFYYDGQMLQVDLLVQNASMIALFIFKQS